MINGIRKICIILEMNNHNTKAGKGSKRRCAGAKIFQLSQDIVQIKIRKKKPIVPTFAVIQMANNSDFF
jgi:hypothetical protein